MLTRPNLLLRIEESILLILTLFAYQHLGHSWLLFAILFLTPDLFMLGYLINPRAGAATYNLAHTLTLALILLLASYLEHWRLASALALIWTAHIAFDRLLGYGLKYPTFFKDTHLQHIPSRSDATS
jgi:membrane-bound ClpP family serine protease